MEDHDFSRQRRQIQPTKKKNSGVKLKIGHVVRFPDYKTTGISTTYEKDLILVEIKKLVLDKKQINMQHQFYIAFPDPTEHQNHLKRRASLLLGIDDRLKEYIRKMVWEENITRVQQMRVLLEVYMKTTLFQGQDIPAIINKRFWPSNVDIQNHIALAVKKQRNKEIDQIDIKLSCLPTTTIIQPLRLTLYLVVYQQLS
ncbi:unnamed protein product [Mytilus coruscus]|uniref:Uncharacterized protein n=1 Tax=Mytilus coruscus TaxID=42192 RepID=A0A6J8BFP7_MYTCO|nr:unnamed protein product [Mytilus coruscus]